MVVRTIGVAEEFLLVDPASGRPVPVAPRVVADCSRDGAADAGTEGALVQVGLCGGVGLGGGVQPAPAPDQVGIVTPALTDLDTLRATLVALRRQGAASAARHGAGLLACGTTPVASPDVPRPRDRGAGPFAESIAPLERGTCGEHVRIAVDSPDEAVAAIDRMRPWVPVLVALAANSPFWHGTDTGYASYRTQLLPRGPAIDVRVSGRHAALEVRVTDVALDVDDAVLVAALVRALADTAARQWREGRPPPVVRAELGRLALWRASRSGLAGVLLDVLARRPVPARILVNRLLVHVRDSLEQSGDRMVVHELAAAVLGRGTGAARQREAFRERGRLDDVVRLLADHTVPLVLTP
ncbi:MAG: carboxylate-amine ligase [Kineosporiaceae bacterium]